MDKIKQNDLARRSNSSGGRVGGKTVGSGRDQAVLHLPARSDDPELEVRRGKCDIASLPGKVLAREGCRKDLCAPVSAASQQISDPGN